MTREAAGVLAPPARDPRFLDEPVWAGYPDLQDAYDPELRLWTDSYSALLPLLR